MWDELTLNPRIQARFNQAMQRAAVERAFFFRAGSESDAVDIAGVFDWAEDGKGFAFTLDARLWYDSEYEAGFPPGMTFSPSGYSWSYHPVPRPAIEWTSPANGAIDVGSGGFSLKFASRMNIDTLKGRIHIEPAPDNLTRDCYSYMNERYDLHFQAQPSTEYTRPHFSGSGRRIRPRHRRSLDLSLHHRPPAAVPEFAPAWTGRFLQRLAPNDPAVPCSPRPQPGRSRILSDADE